MLHNLSTVAIYIGLVIVTSIVQASAQTPPSPDEIDGFSGLHKAAYEDDGPTLKRLIENGADLNARDGFGRTPAHVAAFVSNDEIIRLLGRAGADLNALENGLYDVITIAAVANDPELVSVAIDFGNDPGLTTSIYEGTALIAAAHLGHHEVVRRLTEAGAPLDHINNLHWTALMEAVVLGDGGDNHRKTVRILIDAGADPFIGDREGTPPLDHAVSRGFDEMAEIIRGGSDNK